MTATITWSDQSIVADEVMPYELSRASRNVVHPLIGSEQPAITLKPAGLRRGTLRYFFLSRSTALDAEDAHALADVFTITDPDNPALGMRYVVDGELRLIQDPESTKRWMLEVPIQQVAG